MVNYNNASERLNETFRALAHPARRGILSDLCRGPASVMELAEPYRMSLPAVSKHLRVLESVGLIHRKKDGRVHRISIDPVPMKSVADWVDSYRHFWDQQFAELDQYLKRSNKRKEKHDDTE